MIIVFSLKMFLFLLLCLFLSTHFDFSISSSSFSSSSSVLFLHMRRIGLTPFGTRVKREDPVVLCRELDLVFGYQDARAVNIYLDYSSILTVELEVDIRSTIHPSMSQSKGILNRFRLPRIHELC